FISSRYAL
ncbi:1,4-alpha-glucan-branching enzyme domain protein, partial [Chlamydia psittaci 06-1683]